MIQRLQVDFDRPIIPRLQVLPLVANVSRLSDSSLGTVLSEFLDTMDYVFETVRREIYWGKGYVKNFIMV